MSINEITAKIEALQEWEALASEAAAQVESLKDELKQFMSDQGVEEYEAGTHIIYLPLASAASRSDCVSALYSSRVSGTPLASAKSI